MTLHLLRHLAAQRAVGGDQTQRRRAGQVHHAPQEVERTLVDLVQVVHQQQQRLARQRLLEQRANRLADGLAPRHAVAGRLVGIGREQCSQRLQPFGPRQVGGDALHGDSHHLRRRAFGQVEEPSHETTPEGIAPLAPLGRGAAGEDAHVPRPGRLAGPGEQPALAHARLALVAQVAAATVLELKKQAADVEPLGVATEHRAAVAFLLAQLAHGPVQRHRLGDALERLGRKRREADRATGAARRLGVAQHLARAGPLHEPRGEVRLGPEHAVRRTLGRAVAAGVHRAVGDAGAETVHLADLVARGGHQLERAPDRPLGVVAVGARRAEGGVQVAALVADRHLDQRPAELGELPLDEAQEAVEPLAGPRIGVPVDAGEGEEDRPRRTEVAELASPLRQHLANHLGRPGRGRLGARPRSAILVQLGGRRRRRLGPGRRGLGRVVAVRDQQLLMGLLVCGQNQRPVAVLEIVQPGGARRRRVDQDLARLGQLLGGRQPDQRGTRHHVPQAPVGIPGDEASDRTDRHRHLDAHAKPGTVDRAGIVEQRHLALHRASDPDGAGAVVAVEEAADGVAGEAQYAAPLGVDAGDQRIVDAAQPGAQFFRPAQRSEAAREPFGQRREAGQVGEQRGAFLPVGQLASFRKRMSTILRDVRAERTCVVAHLEPSSARCGHGAACVTCTECKTPRASLRT